MANRTSRNKNGYANGKSEIESRLGVLYFSGSFTSLILTIVMAIAWRYWQASLNVCIGLNCGCILYATSTVKTVTGADASICRFVTFTPLITLIWGCLIGSYHTYRVCILQKNYAHRRTTVTFDTGDARPEQRPKSPWYICLFVVAVLFAILFLAIAAVVTDGYYSTCRAYKKAVVNQLSANGNLAAMVYDRMTCGTTLDFLDYVQPDPEYLESRLRRGTYIINSGLLLQIGIISAWLSVFIWVGISVLNVLLIFKLKTNWFYSRK